MREIEPITITQGEQIEWSRSLSDYPASLWTFEYRFRGDGPGADVSATTDGDDFAATLTATMTALLAIGNYKWQAWVTEIADATNKIHVGSGTVTVERGFVSGDTGDIDLRTPAKIMLDTLDAALLASGSADTIEYEITTPAGSRRVKRSTRTEVLELRKYWAGIVARENAAERLRNGKGYGTAVNLRLHG